MSLRAKYFIIAVVIVGTVGIWLPLVLQKLIEKTITWHNLPQNMTTYYIGIFFAGSIDYFLVKLSELKSGIKDAFLNIIGLLIGMTFLTVLAIIAYIFNYDGGAFFLALIGILIAWKVWWYANDKNPNFVDASATMGGSPEKPVNSGQ